MAIDRRSLAALLGGGAVLAAASGRAATPALPLAADDGSPIRNFPVRRAPARDDLSAFQRFGAATADIVLLEAFDYNCGHCRAAGPELDRALRDDDRLALAILHTPILSPASAEVARLQQTAHRRFGPTAARALHVTLLTARGFLDAARATAVARDLGLDLAEASAEESARAAEDLRRQKRRAEEWGLRITPTFVLGETAFVGWPGLPTLRRMIAAERRCGRPACA